MKKIAGICTVLDYIMIADVEQPSESLPLYVALMMKDDTVSAITFYYPTAG